MNILKLGSSPGFSPKFLSKKKIKLFKAVVSVPLFCQISHEKGTNLWTWRHALVVKLVWRTHTAHTAHTH